MFVYKRKFNVGGRNIVSSYEILEYLGEDDKWAEFNVTKFEEWVPSTGQRTNIENAPVIMISVPKKKRSEDNSALEEIELLPTFRAFKEKWLEDNQTELNIR